jgi:hypothetical protein
LNHYISTMEAAAAAEMSSQMALLPRIGDMVLYRPRRHEVKRGRTEMPAMVIWRNEEMRTLELFVIADANDQINQERVPESPCEGEWGWVRKESPQTAPDALEREAIGQLRGELDALREQIWGDNEPSEGNLAEAVMSFEKRLAKLEKQAAKRKPGRPKNKPKAVAPAPLPDAA